jgi:lysophospholipase L1-like esterase
MQARGNDMIECAIIGDSIALGVAKYREDCSLFATVGITSTAFEKANYTPIGETTIISLGSNDAGNNTEAALMKLRQRLTSKRVIWIMPTAQKPQARAAIQRVADRFQDRVFELRFVSTDGIHPTVDGYIDLARRTK